MLIDYFCAKNLFDQSLRLIYGDQFRELFETEGQILFELGVKDGNKYFKEKMLNDANRVPFFILIKHLPEKYNSAEEFKEIVINNLSPFFEIDDIKSLFQEPQKTYTFQDYFLPYKTKISSEKINKALHKIIPSKVKKLPIFEFLNQYSIYKSSKKVTLATEAGLQIDNFTPSALKYYIERDSLDYLIDDISRIYYQLGGLQAKQKLKQDFIEKIKKHISPESNSDVKASLYSILSGLCFDSEFEKTLLNIQEFTGENGFETDKQRSEKIAMLEKNIDLSQLFKNNL